MRPITILTMAVCTFTLFVMFYNLGGHYLEDWDEGWYALVTKAAIEKHDYLTPEFRNRIYWDRTPFPFYPMMASYALFGINEYSSRIPSAIFAVGLLFVTFLIAKRFYGQWTALLSVLMTVTITQLVFEHGLKTANIESITLFFMFSSLAAWLLIRNLSYRITITMACLAFAFMCKGPVIAIPVVAICLSFVIENPLKSASLKPFLVGLFLACLIVLPWHIYMYRLYGGVFAKNYIIHNFIQRFTEGIDGHQYGPYYFIRDLISSDNFIWVGTALVSIFYFVRLFIKERRLSEFILLAWVIVTFLIVNNSKTQLWWYMFPIFPPLSVMAAKTLEDFVEKRDAVNVSAYYAGLAVIVALIFGHRLFFDNILRIPLIAVGIVLFFLILQRFVNRYMPQYGKGFSIILVSIIFLFPVFRMVKLTVVKDEEPPIMEVLDQLNLGKPVYTFDVFPGGIYYLSKLFDVKEYYMYNDPEKLRDLKGHLVITRNELLSNLQKRDSCAIYKERSGNELLRFTNIKSGRNFTIVKVE